VEQVGNSDEFLDLFVMARWTEGIENRKFNLKTRILIVETLLLFFLNQESLMNLRCSELAEKSSPGRTKVTFASKKKLQRFTCTLAAQYIALLTEDPSVGLDRIGSHTEENFIGNIRMICHGDNRVMTVRRMLSRLELARHLLSTISIERQVAKRINLGGIALGSGDARGFAFEGNSNDFAIELLVATGVDVNALSQMHALLGLNTETDSHRSLIQQSRLLAGEAPLSEVLPRIRNSTRGSQIVSRLHVFGSQKHEMSEPSQQDGTLPVVRRSRVVWSIADMDLLRQAVRDGRGKMRDLRVLFAGRSETTLRSKRREMQMFLQQPGN
jgi:hypothetical protein